MRANILKSTIMMLLMLNCMQMAFSQSRDNIEQIRDYIGLSRSFIGVNNQRAKELSDKALESARQAGIDSLKAKAHRFGGIASYYLTDFNQSLEHYDSALYYFIRSGDSINQARIYNNKGALYTQLNLSQKAIAEYIKARDLYHNLNNIRGLIIIYNNIGSLYQSLREYETAKYYYNQAIELAEKHGHNEELINALSNLAMIYDLEQRTPEAEAAYRNALRKAIQQDIRTMIAALSVNFGTFWVEQNQADSALKHFSSARAFYRDMNLNLSKLYLGMARANKMKALNDQAFNYYKLALENVEKGNDAVLRLRILKELAQMYAGRDNYRNAYELLTDFSDEIELFRNENDSLKSTIIQLHFAISNSELAADSMKTSLAQAENFSGRLSSRINLLSTLIFILIGGCIVFVVLFIIYLKAYRRQKLMFEDNASAIKILSEENESLHKHKHELIIVRKLMQALVNATTNPLGIKDENNNWLIANNPMCSLMGVNAGQLNNCTSEDLAKSTGRSPEFIRTLEVAEEIVWMKGQPSRSEETLSDSKGEFLGDFSVMRVPVSEADGVRKYMIIYITKKAQDIAPSTTSDSTGLLSMLSVLSHEIRTPLNAVIGFSEMLSDTELEPAKRRHYSRIIQRNGQVLLKLMDDLLTFSSLEAGISGLNPTDFDFRELFNNLHTRLVKKALELGKHTLEVRLNIPDKPCLISGDDVRWQQVLDNLTDNALRYTQRGHITIGFRVEESGGNRFITAFVEDSGSGIPEEMQDLVFHPFYRLAEHQGLGSGAGLGLSIVRQLTTLMKVKLDLISKPGEGTLVKLYFEANPPESAGVVRELVSYSEGKLFGKKVLIVEDVESNTELLRIILEGAGAVVIHVTTGEDAVIICSQTSDIDLVLMDIQLPKMNGLEATRQIKAIKPELPVIAHTAYAMANEKVACFEAGCDGYVAKPIKPRLLLPILEQLFEK